VRAWARGPGGRFRACGPKSSIQPRDPHRSNRQARAQMLVSGPLHLTSRMEVELHVRTGKWARRLPESEMPRENAPSIQAPESGDRKPGQVLTVLRAPQTLVTPQALQFYFAEVLRRGRCPIGNLFRMLCAVWVSSVNSPSAAHWQARSEPCSTKNAKHSTLARQPGTTSNKNLLRSHPLHSVPRIKGASSHLLESGGQESRLPARFCALFCHSHD
jgi:hypothetical protein